MVAERTVTVTMNDICVVVVPIVTHGAAGHQRFAGVSWATSAYSPSASSSSITFWAIPRPPRWLSPSIVVIVASGRRSTQC